MAGKVSGVTHPANLADGDTVSETWVDNVTNSIIGLDGSVGQNEIVYVDTTVAETSSSVAETTLWTYTIPANTLGTGNMYHFQCFTYTYNGVGTTYTCTYKLYYGTTSMTFGHELENTSTNLPETIFGSIQANGATNSQVVFALGNGRFGSASEDPQGNIDLTFAEDSTGALDFKLTATLSSSSANIRVGFLWVKLFYTDIT